METIKVVTNEQEKIRISSRQDRDMTGFVGVCRGLSRFVGLCRALGLHDAPLSFSKPSAPGKLYLIREVSR